MFDKLNSSKNSAFHADFAQRHGRLTPLAMLCQSSVCVIGHICSEVGFVASDVIL